MVLLLLIRYVQWVAKRRWTVDAALSTLAAVLVLAMGFLIFTAAGDAAPRDEILIALLR